jgi:hypothetical protein
MSTYFVIASLHKNDVPARSKYCNTNSGIKLYLIVWLTQNVGKQSPYVTDYILAQAWTNRFSWLQMPTKPNTEDQRISTKTHYSG